MKAGVQFQAALLLLCLPTLSAADEQYEAFLEALLRKGYGELALNYIDALPARTDLPVALRDRLDLERSRAMRVAAGEAYDAAQRESRLKASMQLLDKFVKENPSHPAAGLAQLGGGDDPFQGGQQQLAAARGTKDDVVRQQAMAAARSAFAEASKQYTEAIGRLQQRLDSLPKKPSQEDEPPPGPVRDSLESAIVEGRFKLALCRYLTAQTHPGNPKNNLTDAAAIESESQRKAELSAAAKAFDQLFQDKRGRRAAFLAHMWHAKCAEELGDSELALELYDETLAGEPEGSEVPIEEAGLFGQAALFRFRLARQKAEPREAVKEGEQWLEDHRHWEKSAAFQGMLLEVAKLQVSLAQKVTGKAEKRKLLRDVALQLATLGKVDSEYRQEALLLRQELLAEIEGKQTALTFEELLAMGDDAAAGNDLSGALDLFVRAQELVKESNLSKDQPKRATIVGRLADVRYRIAVQEFSAGKLDEALALANQVVKDDKEGAFAQNASSIAIAIGVQKFQAATEAERPAAIERIKKITGFVLKTWPDKPESDDARMALAQVELTLGNSAGALEQLTTVKPQSRRYSSALSIRGQLIWKDYLAAKKAGKDAAELAQLRDQAVNLLQQSVDQQTSSWNVDREPMPQSLFDAQLVLTEMHMEGKQLEQAAPLYVPLIAHLKARRPALTPQLLRLFIGAVQSQLAVSASGQAADVALLAVELSSDAPQPNAVVVDLDKLIFKEIARLEASADESEVKAKEQITALKATQGEIVAKLAPRTELTLPQLVYLGDAATAIGKTELSREVYQRVIAAIEKDPAAQKDAAASITRVRSRLVGLLRSEGELEEALKQADELIKAHPNALEPMLEKGRILLAVAETKAERWQECVSHWTNVRLMLGRVQPRPPEYYEAVYSAAYALLQQSKAGERKEQASQAMQLLKSTLVLAPSLSGPDMVAKFTSLTAQIEQWNTTLAQAPAKKPKTTKGKSATKGAAKAKSSR